MFLEHKNMEQRKQIGGKAMMNENRFDFGTPKDKDYEAYMVVDGQVLAERLSELPTEARCYISGVLRGMELSHSLSVEN